MNPDELPADVRVGARAELEEAAQLDAGIRAALSRLEQAEELIQGQNADDTRATPSCSVNIHPDKIVYHNFDPASDSSLKLKVLREAEGKLDDELSSNKPHTDRHL